MANATLKIGREFILRDTTADPGNDKIPRGGPSWQLNAGRCYASTGKVVSDVYGFIDDATKELTGFTRDWANFLRGKGQTRITDRLIYEAAKRIEVVMFLSQALKTLSYNRDFIDANGRRFIYDYIAAKTANVPPFLLPQELIPVAKKVGAAIFAEAGGAPKQTAVLKANTDAVAQWLRAPEKPFTKKPENQYVPIPVFQQSGRLPQVGGIGGVDDDDLGKPSAKFEFDDESARKAFIDELQKISWDYNVKMTTGGTGGKPKIKSLDKTIFDDAPQPAQAQAPETLAPTPEYKQALAPVYDVSDVQSVVDVLKGFEKDIFDIQQKILKTRNDDEYQRLDGELNKLYQSWNAIENECVDYWLPILREGVALDNYLEKFSRTDFLYLISGRNKEKLDKAYEEGTRSIEKRKAEARTQPAPEPNYSELPPHVRYILESKGTIPTPEPEAQTQYAAPQQVEETYAPEQWRPKTRREYDPELDMYRYIGVPSLSIKKLGNIYMLGVQYHDPASVKKNNYQTKVFSVPKEDVVRYEQSTQKNEPSVLYVNSIWYGAIHDYLANLGVSPRFKFIYPKPFDDAPPPAQAQAPETIAPEPETRTNEKTWEAYNRDIASWESQAKKMYGEARRGVRELINKLRHERDLLSPATIKEDNVNELRAELRFLEERMKRETGHDRRDTAKLLMHLQERIAELTPTPQGYEVFPVVDYVNADGKKVPNLIKIARSKIKPTPQGYEVFPVVDYVDADDREADVIMGIGDQPRFRFIIKLPDGSFKYHHQTVEFKDLVILGNRHLKYGDIDTYTLVAVKKGKVSDAMKWMNEYPEVKGFKLVKYQGKLSDDDLSKLQGIDGISGKPWARFDFRTNDEMREFTDKIQRLNWGDSPPRFNFERPRAAPDAPAMFTPDEGARTSDVWLLPVSAVKTDTKRFQNRKTEYSEASVERIVSDFDPNKLDPIVVWRDPENANIYVLSGHSRFEAHKRLGRDKIKARFFEGTESEAIRFAKVDANRAATSESLVEDIEAFRLDRDGSAHVAPLKKAELKAKWKDKANKLDAYTYLSPLGQFIKTLSQPDLSQWPGIVNKAMWAGELRAMYPHLTDAHEDELFNYMFKTGGSAERMLKMTKEDLFAKVNDRANSIRFDPDEPLALTKVSTGYEARADTGPALARLKEIRKRIEQIDLLSRQTESKTAKAELANEKATLQREAEFIDKDIDFLKSAQNALFGIGEIMRRWETLGYLSD